MKTLQLPEGVTVASKGLSLGDRVTTPKSKGYLPGGILVDIFEYRGTNGMVEVAQRNIRTGRVFLKQWRIEDVEKV